MGGGQQRVINRKGPPRTPTYEEIHTYVLIYAHTQSSLSHSDMWERRRFNNKHTISPNDVIAAGESAC